MSFLAADQLARYRQDGFLVVPGFLAAGTVAAAKAAIAAVCARQAGLTRDDAWFNLEKVGDASLDRDAAPKRPGMLRKIQGAVFAVPGLADVLCAGRILEVVGELMAADAAAAGRPAPGGLWYHSSKVMFKPPGGAAKPWHQDAAYWPQYASDQITVWIALDDADAGNGCVRAIPGSHRLGLIPHVGSELHIAGGRLDAAAAQPIPVPAGGLLVFHSLVVHMSPRNGSDRPRCALICDYDCAANPAMDAGDQRAPSMDATGVWQLRDLRGGALR